MRELPICDIRLNNPCGVCYKCKIEQLEQQLKEANDKIEEINSYIPKIGESSYAMVVKQLEEANEVINSMVFGKKAREYKKKWSEK